MNLTKLEKELLLEFLKDLDNRLGNAGCNDYQLPNTLKHHDLMEKIIKYNYSSEESRKSEEYIWNLDRLKDTKGPYISTIDFLVLGYLQTRVEQLETED